MELLVSCKRIGLSFQEVRQLGSVQAVVDFIDIHYMQEEPQKKEQQKRKATQADIDNLFM